MRQAATCLATALLALSVPAFAVSEPTAPVQNLAAETTPFNAFTGKITRNKVRLRLQPSLDAPILRELKHNDMLIVIGESNEFYAVKPPPDVKAYVFRTFVLDNVIEGNHVNVRLEPDLEAPIIGQLNSGDRIDGTISPLNSKWIEIAPPESSKFFVCKEYVENIGPTSVLSTLTKRRDEVNDLLEAAEESSQAELQKSYVDIHLEKTLADLNRIISQYTDFPDQVASAKELIAQTQDTYIQKKLAYLENKASTTDNSRNMRSEPTQQSPSAQPIPQPTTDSSTSSDKRAAWSSVENALYEAWAQNHQGSSVDDFYAQQRNGALVLTGIVEPYNRSVRNKPGDYILISKNSRLPTAYLYSTKIDLQSKSGKEITIVAIPRPNNNFAFPAYFVLSVE